MNVAFDPWIPVVTISGKPELASLAAVLCEGKQFADLAVRPHERVALMRLFLCVAHAALDGPKDYDEWLEVPEKLPDAAKNYLADWKDSFELFHQEKPWLQVARLKPARKNDVNSMTPLAKLDFALASGAASTIFDHLGSDNANRVFDISYMVLGILAIQNFSTCGLLSRPIWAGKACPNSAKDAPCVTSSMYHLFLIGDNLYTTICINICDFEEIGLLLSGINSNGNWLGRPAWEQMPINDADDHLTRTYLGRLVPISRAILLNQKKPYMLYGEALKYLSYPDFPREANCSIIRRRTKKKEERFLVGARSGVRPWRQLDALLQYNLSGKTQSHPINLNHLANEPIDIWVGALLRNPGKQDIIDTAESRFHLSENFRTQDGCASYSSEVQKSQSIFSLLSKAIYIYRTEIDTRNETGLGESAKSHYWTAVENNLQLLMSHIEAIGTYDAIPTRTKWRKMLFQSACDAYRIACGQETPRQMRAFAKGWQKMTATINTSKIQTDNYKEERHELVS